MKEKDLDKHLDNLIIKGLIQEAEQDNAEFEAAMCNMSDEDFLALIYDHATETAPAFSTSLEKAEIDTYDDLVVSNNELALADEAIPKLSEPKQTKASKSRIFNKDQRILADAECVDEDFIGVDTTHSKQRRLNWKPWLAAIASTAAILVAVLIPGYYSMNARVCESALLASTSFGNPSRAVVISSMSKEEIKEMLPELKMQYQSSLERTAEIRQPEPTDNESYYIDQKDPKKAGMDLVQAYLILKDKGKAIEVLGELSDRYENSDFGEHCKKLLEILK